MGHPFMDALEDMRMPNEVSIYGCPRGHPFYGHLSESDSKNEESPPSPSIPRSAPYPSAQPTPPHRVGGGNVLPMIAHRWGYVGGGRVR